MAQTPATSEPSFHDIKPLPEFHAWNWEIVSLAAIGLALCLIIYFIVRYFRSNRQASNVPQLTPGEKALRSLEQLDLLRLNGGLTIRELGSQSSLIIREYLEAELQFNATDCTVAEIRQRIPLAISKELSALRKEASEKLIGNLISILRFLERLTFADDSTNRFQLHSQELTETLQGAVSWIREFDRHVITEKMRRADLARHPVTQGASQKGLGLTA